MDGRLRTADTGEQQAFGSGAGIERRVRATSVDSEPWIVHGVLAGAIGAAVIAVLFLAFDLTQGRPFWTPGMLGSQVFLGEPLQPGETPEPAVVVGYTVFHGAVFLSMGMVASFVLLGNRRRLGRLSALALPVGLFAAFEIFFLAFAGLMESGLVSDFGLGRITTANLLAAVAMSAALLRPGPRR